MDRRLFLGSMGGAVTSASALESTSIRRSSRIKLNVADTQFIQHLRSNAEYLYLLLLDKATGDLAMVISRWDGTGVRQIAFPAGQLVTSFSLDGNHQVTAVTLSRTQNKRELWSLNAQSGAFEVLSTLESNTPVRDHFVANGSWFGLATGQILSENLESKTQLPAVPTGLSEHVSANPATSSKVLIVERARGVLCQFDPSSRKAAMAPIAAPEITAGLQYFEKYPVRTDSKTPVPGYVVGAHTVTPSGNFSFLAGPLKRELGGTVLFADAGGSIVKRVKLALPSRDESPTIPRALAATEKRVLLIDPQGAIDSYDVG